jgi:hypothetical protein
MGSNVNIITPARDISKPDYAKRNIAAADFQTKSPSGIAALAGKTCPPLRASGFVKSIPNIRSDKAGDGLAMSYVERRRLIEGMKLTLPLPRGIRN